MNSYSQIITDRQLAHLFIKHAHAVVKWTPVTYQLWNEKNCRSISSPRDQSTRPLLHQNYNNYVNCQQKHFTVKNINVEHDSLNYIRSNWLTMHCLTAAQHTHTLLQNAYIHTIFRALPNMKTSVCWLFSE